MILRSLLIVATPYSKTWSHSYSYIDNKIIIRIPYLSDVCSFIFRNEDMNDDFIVSIGFLYVFPLNMCAHL